MRRKLAAVALAAGMFVAAGCGDDDGDEGGKSTEEVCNDLESQLDPLQTDLEDAATRAGEAAQTGDDAALAEAGVELNNVVGEMTDALRTGADEAEDEQFSSDLEASADELDAAVSEAAAGEVPDQTALTNAFETVGQHCGE